MFAGNTTPSCSPESRSSSATIFPVRVRLRCAAYVFLMLSFADHLLPPDSRVEIDAKIAAGYFTSGKQLTEADLVKTVGRAWEETEH